MSHPPANAPDRYRVGDLELDVSGGLVSRDGQPIQLQRLSFDLLVALVRRYPKVVPNDELLEALWPGQFIAEENLKQRVRLLRKALGDDAHDPRYVATVRGWGYRFVARVKPLEGSATDPASAASRDRRPWRRVVVLTAVLLGLAVGIHRLWSPPRQRPESSVKKLAVLPLRNLGTLDQEYLAEGIHEALISDLSKIPALRVTSRTSAQLYREASKPMPEIAGELGVDYLVEGSVLREGNRVRVFAQLIDGRIDGHLWSEGFDRELESTLVLVGEIAHTISGEIEIVLSPQTRKLLARGPIRLDVLEAYMKTARYQLNRFSAGSAHAALELYQEAVRLDPGFATAHAEMAFAHLILQQEEESRSAAERALALDPRAEMAHLTLGYLHLAVGRDWEAARQAFARALEINPSNAISRHAHADYLSLMGRLDAAVEEVRQGAQCDPMAPIAQRPVTYHLILARRFGEAIAEARRLSTAGLATPGVRHDLARALWHEGSYDEALDDLRTQWGFDTRAPVAIVPGRPARDPRGELQLLVSELAKKADLEHHPDPMSVAELSALAGEVDSAFEWLERAVEAGSLSVLFLRANPDFDSLRAEPRFEDLLHRLQLP